MGWFEQYVRLAEGHAGFRKATRRFFYQFLGTLRRDAGWTFMNYGYAPVHPADHEFGPERYCASLYRRVATGVDGAEVLEVGCGRGGGAAFVRKQLGAASVVGLDFAGRAISLCRKLHPLAGLSFVVGDAEALPFADGSFDAVLNIESSHCYASLESFLAEVHRVLRPGGRFLFADFRWAGDVAGLDAALAQAGFRTLRREDITENVVAALRADGERRLQTIRRVAPKPFHPLGRQFAGSEGSLVLGSFTAGTRRYLSWELARG
jgi:SAM-dependent methyltransferase